MSFIDDILLKIDNAVGLYDKLKALDAAFGEKVRQQLLEDFGDPEDWAFWSELIAKAPSLTPAQLFQAILTKQNGFANATSPVDVEKLIKAYRDGQKENAKPPIQTKPSSGIDGVFIPEDNPLTDKPRGKKPPVKTPTRKLSPPPLYKPGATATKKTPPITANQQIASKVWGELICYSVEQAVNVPYIPESSFSTAYLDERSSQAMDALMSWLSIDSLPIPVEQRDELKTAISYFAASAWVGTDNLRGLTGEVGIMAGSDSVLNLASILGVLSMNAYIGFEPSLYLETNYYPVDGNAALSRPFKSVPVISGRSPLKQEAIELADKDLGYFLGVPWDYRSKGLPKRANLQILFYPKDKPPYGRGENRLYPSEFNIPDPRALTWQEIKDVCEPYKAGPVYTSVGLTNGRKLGVWADTKETGRDVLTRMSTLCTADITDGFTYMESDLASKPTKMMYPGQACLDVTETDTKPERAKFLLWVEKEEDANFRIVNI